MGEPIRIVAVIEGGVLQSILTAGVAVECVTVDYDIEGGAVDVPQWDGKTASASVSEPYAAELNGPFVMAAFERFGAPCCHDWGGPPSLGAECLNCGTQCEERVNADGSPFVEPYTYADVLQRYDSGDINDEQAIAELQQRGWTERRAYVILNEHQAA